jgi:hypothetical protein
MRGRLRNLHQCTMLWSLRPPRRLRLVILMMMVPYVSVRADKNPDVIQRSDELLSWLPSEARPSRGDANNLPCAKHPDWECQGIALSGEDPKGNPCMATLELDDDNNLHIGVGLMGVQLGKTTRSVALLRIASPGTTEAVEAFSRDDARLEIRLLIQARRYKGHYKATIVKDADQIKSIELLDAYNKTPMVCQNLKWPPFPRVIVHDK